MRITKLIICAVFGITFILGTGRLCEYISYSQREVYTEGYYQGYCDCQNVPKSISETQEALKELGYYHGKIDGIWGPKTERAFCNYQAAKYFKAEKK